jgi:hypothetical protein
VVFTEGCPCLCRALERCSTLRVIDEWVALQLCQLLNF